MSYQALDVDLVLVSLHVGGSVAFRDESLPALMTLERSLVHVRADVGLQVACLAELLHAGVERTQQAPLLPLGDSAHLHDVCRKT